MVRAKKGGGGGRPMRGPRTDHVTSGPMRGLEKKTALDGANRQTHTHTHTDGHGDSMTENDLLFGVT